jgi:excinuclease UvrABC nuclease subunit
MVKLKKSKWLPPYIAPSQTTFKHLRKRSGVYFIKDGKDIVYVGHSRTQLYKTLYRHFQRWKHPFQKVVTYRTADIDQFKVRVILCSPARAEKLEQFFIKKFKPRDNREKYEQLNLPKSTEALAQKVNQTKVCNVDFNDNCPF